MSVISDFREQGLGSILRLFVVGTWFWLVYQFPISYLQSLQVLFAFAPVFPQFPTKNVVLQNTLSWVLVKGLFICKGDTQIHLFYGSG